MIKILIIGFGSIARKHVEAFNALQKSFMFYALRFTPNSQEIAGVHNLYGWDSVPYDIDFAIISNPTNLHVGTLEECIQRKLPVMIEKPVSDSLAGLNQVVQKLEENDIPTYVSCNLRFLPVLQFVKAELERTQPRINEVNIYCGSDLRTWRPGTDYQQSYSANESRGGGVHLDLFHELDYLVWILGMPAEWRGITRRVSSIEIQAADFAQYQLFYPSYTATVTLNYYRQDAKRQFELLFDEATWIVDLIQGTVTTQAGKVIFVSLQAGILQTYLLQAEHVLQALLGKERSINTIQESINILKICLSSEKIK